MKAKMEIDGHSGLFYAHIASKPRKEDSAFFRYYGATRTRRSTAIRDGLRFADEHNIEITNRKEFEG